MTEKESNEEKFEQRRTEASCDGLAPVGSKKAADKSFPIVGLGASAGGLKALKSFFSEVPGKSGMAYIVLIHMSPEHPSMMPELLQKNTQVPVSAAADGQVIEPDHVYVTPPDKEISLYQGKIQLLDIVEKHKVLPIDQFLRSLAQDQKSNASAVILSGTGTDGTIGIRDIKAHDGLVLAQSRESADHDGMPASARHTGLVDIIAAPEELPQKIIDYYAHTELSRAQKTHAATDLTSDQRDWLNKVFAILRTRKGHDFSNYKPNTILRRISRRMAVNDIDSHETYVRYIRETPAEAEALFRELLIGVTSFFRESKAFDVLKAEVFPALIDQMKENETFRAWIPACSTGEEAFSLAIILREYLDDAQKQINIQLFGTDIDEYAIERAREGRFPDSIAADVSQKRLERFFTKEGTYYRIGKEIRDFVVFSVQDVTRDPPFSRLNLLCCRNLLIYLEAHAQQKLLPLFHYTLVPGGVLMLGTSETIGGFTRMFEPIDKKLKIYERKEVPRALSPAIEFPSRPSGSIPRHAEEDASAELGPQKTDIKQATRELILSQYAPTSLLIDAEGNILYVQGRTGKYLETSTGPPTQNILNMAREGLQIELLTALRKAKSANDKVRRRRIQVKTNGDKQLIDLHIQPLQEPKELAGRFLVVIEDIESPAKAPEPTARDTDQTTPDTSRIAELEKELQVARESHQTTIEELESSNEELQSTNEELQSANEELQSTNEELESSKEELQSLNEELQTVNSELESKVEELYSSEDDMRNLLENTEIATIFVDSDLRIRRYTPEATHIVNLIESDIGRPLQHVGSNLAYNDMSTDIDEVLKKLMPKEKEVQTAAGNWYKMRIRPYRARDNRIDGAVLVFFCINDQKQSQALLEETLREKDASLELVRTVFDMNPKPLAVLDKKGRLVIANTALSEILGLAQEDVFGKDIFALKALHQEQTELETGLKAALDQGKDFKNQTIEIDTPEGCQRFAVSGRITKKEEDFPYRILLQLTKQYNHGVT